MKLPIVAYGDPVLKRVAEDIDPAKFPDLKQLIADMYETMYAARGVGLAAPQIGKSIRLFVIDAIPFGDEEPELKKFKKTFINAHIIEETGEKWPFNEGCLSIPDIREDVYRCSNIRISYYDENWEHHEEAFKGMAARIIQHEYDHTDGKLFTDYLSPLRKRMLQNRLNNISRGAIKAEYKMKFPVAKKGR